MPKRCIQAHSTLFNRAHRDLRVALHNATSTWVHIINRFKGEKVGRDSRPFRLLRLGLVGKPKIILNKKVDPEFQLCSEENSVLYLHSQGSNPKREQSGRQRWLFNVESIAFEIHQTLD